MAAERLRILRGELIADAQLLDGMEQKWRLIQEKLARIEPDEFDYVALAYTLANLYSVMENYFLRVAKSFENRLDPSQWHRDLLDRMAIDIVDVRPALLTSDERSASDELRAFRHVFRPIYQGQLDVEKLELVDRRAPEALAAFRGAHRRFLPILDRLIRNVSQEEPEQECPAGRRQPRPTAQKSPGARLRGSLV
jgi:hypothetical protein